MSRYWQSPCWFMWDLLEVEYKSTQDVQKQNITLMDVHFNEHVIIDKKLFWLSPAEFAHTSDLSSLLHQKKMSPFTLASKARRGTHEGCFIIHELLLDTNWAALHSQIQSEAPAEIICWSRVQEWWWVSDEHDNLLIVSWWLWMCVLYVCKCMGACS